MSFVPVKAVEQQGLSMPHCARSQPIGQRTQLVHAVRGAPERARHRRGEVPTTHVAQRHRLWTDYNIRSTTGKFRRSVRRMSSLRQLYSRSNGAR